MRSKKWFSLISIIVALSMFLVSCAPAATPAPAQPGQPAATSGSNAQPTNPPQSSNNSNTKISVWLDAGSDATTAKCIQTEVVDAFNKTNPGFTVEAVLQSNAWDAIRTAVAGGGGPDVVYTPGPSFVYQMAKAGQLLPLDQYISQYQWDQHFTPWALDLGKVNGKLYSIPNEIETMVLYYNKTVFDKNGWKPPTTMDEYMALMDKVKQAGLIANAAGNADWRPTDEHYVTVFLNQVAGPQKVYDALKGNVPWTDPAFAKSIDLLTQAVKAGYWQGGLDRYYTAKGPEFLTDFGDGKAAMMLSGTWWMGQLDQYFGQKAGNSNEWDWVAPPSVDGKAVFDLGIGSTWSINASTKHPKEAADFLNYFFSTKGEVPMIAKCGVAPAPIKLTESDLQGLDARRIRLITQLNDAAAKGDYGYTTWTFWPPKSDTYIYDKIEDVWAGNTTVQQYLEGLNTQFQEELKAGDIPPIPTR